MAWMWVVPAILAIVVILLWRVVAAKTASADSSSGAKDGDKKKGGWITLLKWGIAVVVIIGIILIVRSCTHERVVTPATRPLIFTGPAIVPGDGEVVLKRGDLRVVELDEEKWSEWINLVDPGSSWQIKSTNPSPTPGWIQDWFWSKEEPEPVMKTRSWVADPPSSIFRVRGTPASNGKCIIYVR